MGPALGGMVMVPRFLRMLLASRDPNQMVEREVQATLYPRWRLGIAVSPIEKPTPKEGPK